MSSIPRLIPGGHVGDARRYRPAASQNRRVPLWTSEPEGKWIDGKVRVPTTLLEKVPGGFAPPAQHTNKRHRYEEFIKTQLARWIEWRAKKGWFIDQGSILIDDHVSNPAESDRERAKRFQKRAERVIGKARQAAALTDFDYAEETQDLIVRARFQRHDPVFVRMEDMLFLRHLALRYGVDPDRDTLPENELPPAQDVIDVQGGEDPMVVAEERRQRLGLKREDYLMGKVEDPL